ncbi:MAG: cysteine desulfurase family protein, partial [Acidimicrobiia bacterium]
MTRAYLDHASSSPLRPVAFEAMLPYWRDHPGDPGRLHAEGRVTRVAVEVAREQVGALFVARPREVVFTASATEAVNTAIWGARARVDHAPAHIVTTAVEQASVLESCHRDERDEVTVIGVDRTGRFDADEVLAALRPDTALVSVQLANHEVGTLQPAAAVVQGARERGVIVHVDATAAAGHVPVDFAALGADLCSVTGHTWGGPTGAAALLVRRGLRFAPFVVGGSQERARRAGLEAVAAIVGFGAAAEALTTDDALTTEATTARALVARLAAGAVAVPGVERFGDPIDGLPQLLCFGVDGVEAEPILLALDQHGVAAHSGSSCSSEALEPSPVLAAMGVDADHSLRLSTGWNSTDEDVQAFLDG